MKICHARFLALALTLAIAPLTLHADTPPGEAKTLAYIDRTWSTLTRSLHDCAAVADDKVRTTRLLYVPAGFTITAELTELKKRCGITIAALPKRIEKPGDIEPGDLLGNGVLYLPKPYVVPGGFFNEMYGWDSYFIVLGLIADKRYELARGMVENQLFEVEHYGAVLNANRSYYLTRSQPPFLSSMMRAVLAESQSFANPEQAQEWLAHAYPLAVRDHDVWLRSEHLAGDTGLSRYFDYGAGPVPEMRDARYLREVIRWLRAHAQEDPGYLIPPNTKSGARHALAPQSCDITKSRVCADAQVDGYRLTADFYLGDRAMRESGFDVTFRFGPFAGSTHHYAPVCLNSLLYRYELDLADFATRLGRAQEAQAWRAAAQARREAIDKYLWHADEGIYQDYDFVAAKPAHYDFITAFYPLWSGAASQQQALALAKNIALFERKGGLAMSTRVSGAQWDAPFGWAPSNWLAIAGLDAYGMHEDAQRLARKFMATIERSLAKDGTIREKYNVETGDATVNIKAGYKDNVIGFGWSNGVYLKLAELVHASEQSAKQ